MKRFICILTMLAGLTTVAQPTPTVPASQAEVNAGTIHTKFVAPDTLAGLKATNQLSINYKTNLLVTLAGTATANGSYNYVSTKYWTNANGNGAAVYIDIPTLGTAFGISNSAGALLYGNGSSSDPSDPSWFSNVGVDPPPTVALVLVPTSTNYVLATMALPLTNIVLYTTHGTFACSNLDFALNNAAARDVIRIPVGNYSVTVTRAVSNLTLLGSGTGTLLSGQLYLTNGCEAGYFNGSNFVIHCDGANIILRSIYVNNFNTTLAGDVFGGVGIGSLIDNLNVYDFYGESGWDVWASGGVKVRANFYNCGFYAHGSNAAAGNSRVCAFNTGDGSSLRFFGGFMKVLDGPTTNTECFSMGNNTTNTFMGTVLEAVSSNGVAMPFQLLGTGNVFNGNWIEQSNGLSRVVVSGGNNANFTNAGYSMLVGPVTNKSIVSIPTNVAPFNYPLYTFTTGGSVTMTDKGWLVVHFETTNTFATPVWVWVTNTTSGKVRMIGGTLTPAGTNFVDSAPLPFSVGDVLWVTNKFTPAASVGVLILTNEVFTGP